MSYSNFVRKYYDKAVKNINYEKERWFKDKASEERFEETKKSVIFHLGKNKFENALEIGSGPGTWSRILANNSKNLVLVDISKEMLRQAKNRLKKEKIKYACCDFLDFSTNEKFDLVFSSRAIEYMPDKKRVLEKMHGFLKNKGKLIIITKNPARRWKILLLGKKVEEIHKNWISINELRKIMENNSFKKIEVYPAVFSLLPFPNFIFVRKLNSFLHLLFYKKTIVSLLIPFLESYIVVAYKS